MGEIIVRKVRGMNWMAKISLVLIFTLVFSTFMYQGWYSPKRAHAVAPANVQSTTGNTGTNQVNTFNLTAFGAAPTAGNTLVAVISTRGTTANRVSSVTSTGATWSFVAQATNANGTTTEIWYAPNVSAGAGTTITVNLAANLRAAAVAIEYSGILTAGAVDQTASSTGNSATASTGTTAATTQADELWIGGVGLVNSGYTLGTITNGFATVANAASTNFTAGNNARTYALEKIVSATATAFSGGTISTSSQWSGAIATFKAQPGSFATYYALDLTATNVGVDGTTDMTTLADVTVTGGASNENRVMMNTTAPSGTTRYRISEGAADTRTGQEFFRSYTPAYGQATQISANATAYASFYMRTTGTSVVAKATLYEYNDTTGIVGAAKGTASFTGNAAATTLQTMNNVSFGNSAFTVTSGNGLLVVWSFDMNNSRPSYLWGQASSATPSGYQSITVLEAPLPTTLTLSDNGGTNPAAKNVYRKDCNHAVDSFTLQAAGGDVSVTQMVVTGTNMVGNVVKVRIFDDSTGLTANEYDASDTLIGETTTISSNSVTVPVTATITSGSTVRYIIAYDFSATIANPTTFTGTLGSGSITSDAGSTTYNADTSATLTAQNTTVTVGEGTNPGNKSVQQGSTTPSSNNAVAAFTLTGTPAAAQNDPTVSQIVITGTNVANVAANGVKLWQDTGATPNEWDAGDTQIGTAVSFSGSTATFSGLTIAAPATGATYIVTYDIAVGATVGQTVTGYVSSITSDANTNTNSDNNTDATLTIAAGTCNRVAPTVDLGGNGTAPVGGTKQYTLTITNNDSPAAFCSNSTFTLSILSETGDTGSFTLPSTFGSTSTGAIAAGATYNTTFTVTATAGATVGHALTSTVRAADATNHNALPGSGSVVTTVVTAYTNSMLLHNSTNTGSTAWSGNGGWGIPGGKYGAFVCETCHTKSTTNIKRIKTAISTPDNTNWPNGANTTNTISFTQATGSASDMGKQGTTNNSGICNVCHSPTYHSNYYWNGPATATHNLNTDCTTCHKHNAAFSGDGPCLGCHNAALTDLYNPRDVSADFTRLSRHVSNGTATSIVTNYDCVVCHAEGDATKVSAGTGWIDKSKHKNGTTNTGTLATDRMVKLRNVDNITQSFDFSKNVLTKAAATAAEKEKMRTDLDTFCLNCHDADGASGLDVNGTTGLTVPAASGTTPFNSSDNLRNGRDGFTTRAAITNVKGQFATGTYTWNANNTTMPAGFNGTNYNGNPSTHAVLGPRYSTNNGNWATTQWVNHTLRSGQVQNSVRETAKLHCSDCHLSETNAHGASNAWHMLLNGTANDYTTDYAMANVMPSTAASVVCYKCHSNTVYGGTSSTLARWNHYNVEKDWYDGGNYGGPTGSDGHNLGATCHNCHGGQDFGGIHGVSGQYNPTTPTFPASGTTYTRYRFMPGGWMFWKPGTAGNDNDWSTTSTGTCYLASSSTWSVCSSHGGRNTSGGTTNYARPTKY